MLQKNSFANLCVMGWGFFRICCWKTDFLLKWFPNSHFGKRDLGRTVAAAECVHVCVRVCVCVPSQSYTSKGYKSIFLVERPRTAPTPGWPRPLPELFVVEAGLCTQTNSFFLAAVSALGRDAAANTREMFVPEDSAGIGSEPNAVQVWCERLPEPTTSFSSSPRVCSGGCRAW